MFYKFLVLVAISLFASFQSQARPLVVSSKKFIESQVLAEIISQHLENSNFQVTRQFGLGGTFIAYKALEAEEIDIYVEYTGTLSEAIFKVPGLPNSSIEKKLKEKNILMFPPLGFSNNYAIVTRKKLAHEKHIRSISDLQKFPSWIGGLEGEFHSRSDGWKSLSKTYNLKNTVKRIEHPMSYQALANNKIEFSVAYTTDPNIAEQDLFIIEDDKKFFPDYSAVPIAHSNFPSAAQIVIRQLKGQINNSAMIRLNSQALQRIPLKDIAHNFLIETKLKKGNSVQLAGSNMDWWAMGRRTQRHLFLTFIAVFFATLVSVPLAFLIHKYKGLAPATLTFASIMQTIPSIALLAIMIPFFGIGILPAIVGLFLYSLLPILRNTYAALNSLDPRLQTAAQGLGLYPKEILFSVTLPLCFPVILAGLRTATVISIGTATLAAFIGAGGLGEPIVQGLSMNDSGTILEGAIPAALLAIVIDGILSLAEKRYTKKM